MPPELYRFSAEGKLMDYCLLYIGHPHRNPCPPL